MTTLVEALRRIAKQEDMSEMHTQLLELLDKTEAGHVKDAARTAPDVARIFDAVGPAALAFAQLDELDRHDAFTMLAHASFVTLPEEPKRTELDKYLELMNALLPMLRAAFPTAFAAPDAPVALEPLVAQMRTAFPHPGTELSHKYQTAMTDWQAAMEAWEAKVKALVDDGVLEPQPEMPDINEYCIVAPATPHPGVRPTCSAFGKTSF